MAERGVNATASRKVELAVNELEALSVPPCVAVQYLSRTLQGRFSPASLSDIIECEPALAARILSLAQSSGAGPAAQRHSVRLVLDRLGTDEVRDALLGIRVSAGFEIAFGQEQPAVPARGHLILHSLAVACCAEKIAQTAPLDVDPQVAYSAGLLHDIGKFALQDIMPKSLAAIAREAEAEKTGLCTVEQKHLGTHHALLGRQLARKWRLAESIGLGIWLHHSDAAAIAAGIPEAAVALVVRAADHIARHLGIGQSGSYDAPQPIEALAESVGLDARTLAEMGDALAAEVQRKSEALGLETPNATAKYCDLIHEVAADLSKQQSKLSLDNRNLRTTSSYLDFVRDFFLDIGPDNSAIDIAEDFARRWQRFFQTGTVCLYLAGGKRPGAIDAAVVEALGHSRKVVLETPAETLLRPPALTERFAVLEAKGYAGWLVEQLDVNLDLARTKLVPLLSNGQVVGAIAFELNYPGDLTFFAEKFETAAAMAGIVLGLALQKDRQEHFTERLAPMSGPVAGPIAGPSEPVSAVSPLSALAEMAAGVAHELNNPLSVISGRAQLLADAETDEEKQHALEQIQDNAREASEVIDNLMSFAQPSKPRVTRVAVRQIVDEALELARQKSPADHLNTQVRIGEDVTDVSVDSAQVVSALANIISNAIESYSGTLGPIKIVAESHSRGVRLQVGDLGCGMDEETLQKATHPFFSAKPAGRQRGMGLAYATRLIQLNGGSLAIDSTPKSGTTVTVTLPNA